MLRRSAGLLLMVVLGVVLAPGGLILAQPHNQVKAQPAASSLVHRPERFLNEVIPWPLTSQTTPEATPYTEGLTAIIPPSRSPDLTPTMPMSALPPSPPQWRWQPAGEVVVPILLYHHISQAGSTSRYVVSLKDFEAQMASLQRWGYTTISLGLLHQALTQGAALPAKPLLITFDDGYQEVYTQALPVLQRYGFTGVVLVVVGQVGVGKSLNADQIRALAAAGWEIGSHSWSHVNLRRPEVKLKHEIEDSRLVLEQLSGQPISVFAFPYGVTSPYVTRLVQEAGYAVALGLGGSYRHKAKGRYYLSRIEIQGGYDLETFASLLPKWDDDEAGMDDEEQFLNR